MVLCVKCPKNFFSFIYINTINIIKLRSLLVCRGKYKLIRFSAQQLGSINIARKTGQMCNFFTQQSLTTQSEVGMILFKFSHKMQLMSITILN